MNIKITSINTYTVITEGRCSYEYYNIWKTNGFNRWNKKCHRRELGRLDFYLHPETDVKVTVSAKKARQKVEVTIIPISGPIIRAEDNRGKFICSYRYCI